MTPAEAITRILDHGVSLREAAEALAEAYEAERNARAALAIDLAVAQREVRRLESLVLPARSIAGRATHPPPRSPDDPL